MGTTGLTSRCLSFPVCKMGDLCDTHRIVARMDDGVSTPGEVRTTRDLERELSDG